MLNKHEGASTPGSQSKVIRDSPREPVDQLPSRKPNGDTPPKAILKSPKKKHILPDDDVSSPPPHISQKIISRGVKDRLAIDDAEIAALEKALGLKDKKKLPKSFEEDGLDHLLGGLGDELSGDGIRGKRKRDDGEEWLERKRRKARGVDRDTISIDPSAMDDSEGTGSSFDGLSDPEMGNEDHDHGNEGVSTGSESQDDSMSQDSSGSSSGIIAAKNGIRENPYRAPVTAEVAAPKYTPPSLRNRTSSETEDRSRLRRKVQGLINRLSEANLISILGNVESLYQTNARQHVSLTLLDILFGLLSDPASLQDTFVILHAGFMTAVYKMIGPDFGAQVIQRIDEEFRLNLDVGKDDERLGKKLTNLASLLSSLYTFQVVGSKLIYDYIKIFIEDLSEDKVELLLKILRSRLFCLDLSIVFANTDGQMLDHSYGRMILRP